MPSPVSPDYTVRIFRRSDINKILADITLPAGSRLEIGEPDKKEVYRVIRDNGPTLPVETRFEVDNLTRTFAMKEIQAVYVALHRSDVHLRGISLANGDATVEQLKGAGYTEDEISNLGKLALPFVPTPTNPNPASTAPEAPQPPAAGNSASPKTQKPRKGKKGVVANLPMPAIPKASPTSEPDPIPQPARKTTRMNTDKKPRRGKTAAKNTSKAGAKLLNKDGSPRKKSGPKPKGAPQDPAVSSKTKVKLNLDGSPRKKSGPKPKSEALQPAATVGPRKLGPRAQKAALPAAAASTEASPTIRHLPKGDVLTYYKLIGNLPAAKKAVLFDSLLSFLKEVSDAYTVAKCGLKDPKKDAPTVLTKWSAYNNIAFAGLQAYDDHNAVLTLVGLVWELMKLQVTVQGKKKTTEFQWNLMSELNTVMPDLAKVISEHSI